MDLDIPAATSADQRDAATARLQTRVAIAVALVSTFMALCKVKDDNIVQAMQQAQADKIDHWSYYQTRKMREDLAKATASELKLYALAAPATAQEQYRAAIATYDKLAADQAQKRADVAQQAEDDQQRYDALNYHDDQFDLADAALSLSIALFALTALTHKRWLFGLALVPTAVGTLMGLAGICGWQIHSALLARLLS